MSSRSIRRALASALKPAGFMLVGGHLVKSFDESFAAVGITKDAFARCWRFTWSLGFKQLSPWLKEPSDYLEVCGQVSTCKLHWRDKNQEVWFTPFLTDLPGLAAREIHFPAIFDQSRLLPKTDPMVISNALHRIPFTDIDLCVSRITCDGIPWLESMVTKAQLADAHRKGGTFYLNLPPKAQALISE